MSATIGCTPVKSTPSSITSSSPPIKNGAAIAEPIPSPPNILGTLKPSSALPPTLKISPSVLNLPPRPNSAPIPPVFPKIPFAAPPREALPNKPPKAVPGIPKLAAPNNAALPNGDLTTFFTAFLAFLTIYLENTLVLALRVSLIHPCYEVVFPYPFLKLP